MSFKTIEDGINKDIAQYVNSISFNIDIKSA